MEPVKLLERAASGAAHAIRHPISSAAYAAGIVRGLAGVAMHGATERGHHPVAGTHHVPTQRRVPAAEQYEPRAPGESFATEPKATSRASDHGRGGADAEIDQWYAEPSDDVDVETPVGTTGAGVGHNPDTAEADLQQPGTEPLVDSASAKAIRSESEMLRKDAERNPD
jgi:hypothetical protein